MTCSDPYELSLTASAEAADCYRRGLRDVLRLRRGGAELIARSVVIDPTFALGHAALGLLGYEMCLQVDVAARLLRAEELAGRSTARERSHVHAVAAHVRGDSKPLLRHIREHPRDALLLSTAVPTIAFAGVTEVPEQTWALVEEAAPAYGDDWWFTGLLAFIRQEQGRFDEAMELSCRSLAVEPAAGHSAHARAHAHYETADHRAGLAWMDDWVRGAGAATESLTHFSWHAALHELSVLDLDAVRRRYDEQLRPRDGVGCRPLVDSGSLLWRWALTPGAVDVPSLAEVTRTVGAAGLLRPATPFLALHAAVALLGVDDVAGLRALAAWSAAHRHPVHRRIISPLAEAMALMAAGSCALAADRLAGIDCTRLGGSAAQREIVEETRIAALLRAGRLAEARELLDRRLERRSCPRDAAWRREASGVPVAPC